MTRGSSHVCSNSAIQQNTNNLQTNTQIKPKKPPTYDGTTGWQDFLVQFEMIAEINRWDNYTMAYELATSLRGVAQEIVTEMEPARRLNYRYLVSTLTSRFEPPNQENMYKVQMHSYHRKSGQALPEMAQEIRKITRRAYPTAPLEIRDQLAKDCFIKALDDPKIQLSIFQREPKTIEDCIRYGVEYEAFMLVQKRAHFPRQGLHMITEDSDDHGDGQKQVRFTKIGEQNQNRNQTFNKNHKLVVCYYCRNKGHIRRDCLKLKADNKKLLKSGNLPTRTDQSTRSTQTYGPLRSKFQENI